MTNFAVITRTVPALCRNRELRLNGVRPSDARDIRRLSDYRVDLAATPLSWIYVPGNSSDHPWLRDTGLWVSNRDFMAGGYDTITGRYILDLVWHHGARWKCLVQSTREEPAPGCKDWALVGTYSELAAILAISPSFLSDTDRAYDTFEAAPSITLLGDNLTASILEAAGFAPFPWTRRREPRTDAIVSGDEKWDAEVGASLGLEKTRLSTIANGTGHVRPDEGVESVTFTIPVCMESDTDITLDALLCRGSEKSVLRDANGEILMAISGKYLLSHRTMITELKHQST